MSEQRERRRDADTAAWGAEWEREPGRRRGRRSRRARRRERRQERAQRRERRREARDVERRAARGPIGHDARRGRRRRRALALLRGTISTALLIVAALVPLTIWTRSGLLIGGSVTGPIALLVALQLIGLRVFRAHRRTWRFTTLGDVVAIGAGLALGSGVHMLLGELVRVWDVPVFRAAAAFPIGLELAMLLLAVNLLVLVRIVRRLTHQRRRRDDDVIERQTHAALILGAGRVAAGVLRDAFVHHDVPPRIIGLLADDAPRGELVSGARVLGRIDDLESIARSTGATMLIVALDDTDPDRVRAVVARAQRIGLLVRIRPAEPLAGVDRDALVVRSVDLGDLMPRAAAEMDTSDVSRLIAGRTVVVTGAGGSIGSELARQILRFRPSRLVLIDRSEYGLWGVERSLLDEAPLGVVEPLVLDVRDQTLLFDVFQRTAPAVVFHAAALKHVPMLERNISAAVLNNVIGTASVAETAMRTGVTRLVLVSTDKAVAPTSVMGATKRIAERIVSDAAARSGRDYVSVRFGNVLGSSGSVLEIFRTQIAQGGPITITDPAMTRFFMTIPEAAGLVLHAATLDGSGDILILDMGTPRRIVDLAEDLVRLHGLEPGRDIEIAITGRRAGEKLHEDLASDVERLERTSHPSILTVRPAVRRWPERDDVLTELRDLARSSHSTLRTRLLQVANEDLVAAAALTRDGHVGDDGRSRDEGGSGHGGAVGTDRAEGAGGAAGTGRAGGSGGRAGWSDDTVHGGMASSSAPTNA
jgi:FlaA1/EpsC-like NDP-sugar epimerase